MILVGFKQDGEQYCVFNPSKNSRQACNLTIKQAVEETYTMQEYVNYNSLLRDFKITESEIFLKFEFNTLEEVIDQYPEEFI